MGSKAVTEFWGEDDVTLFICPTLSESPLYVDHPILEACGLATKEQITYCGRKIGLALWDSESR